LFVDRFGLLSGHTREQTKRGQLTTEDNGVEFTHPRIQDRGRRNEGAAYGNQTEERRVGRKAQSNAVVMCLPLKARAPYKPGMFVISDKITLLQGNVAHYIISVFNLASGTPLGTNAST
jgi:hypothetical protein